MNDSNISKSYLWGLFKVEAKANTTPPAAGKPSGISFQIIQQFKDRSRAELSKWQQAIDAAGNPENPQWGPLQDLFDNLQMDGHLIAVMGLRKAATLSSKFDIKDKRTKKALPELTELLETEWFYQIMEHVIDSVFKKYSVIELVDPTSMKWDLIPRRNCVPQKGLMLFESNGDKGIYYTDPSLSKNVLEVKSLHSFGLLNDIVPQLIWKRNAQQAWADFGECFGIPLVTAETTKTDQKDLDKLEASLRALGQAAQAILPQGTKITIHDSATKGDPHKIFLEQIKTTNSEISKAIVGGTMIVDDGSSRSQSEVHERMLNTKIAEFDRRTVEFFVNGKLLPLLRQWGYKFPDTCQFVFDRTEQLSLSELWDIVEGILADHDVDIQWISETFNIPIIGKKAPVGAAPSGSPTIPPAKARASLGDHSLSSNFQ